MLKETKGISMAPISVVIPAYNESESIEKAVRSIKDFMTAENIEHEVIVVDDCSTDDTAKRAKGSGAAVISHPANRGYGASITTGLRKSKYEWVLIMDGDGTYPAAEVKKLTPYTADFDMVVGARRGKHYHGSLTKRFSRAVLYVLLAYVTGESVPDANSGLRLFKKSVVMKFEDDFCGGFSFTTTITLLLLSNRHLIKFVPVEYAPRVGRSKVRYLRDTARTFQILAQNISYYNHTKAFLPFWVLSFLLFMLFTALYLFRARALFYGLSAVVSFFFSMLFLGLGLVAYVIMKSRR